MSARKRVDGAIKKAPDSKTPVAAESVVDPAPDVKADSFYDETPIVVERAPPRDKSKDRHPVVDPAIHSAHAMRLLAPELVSYEDNPELSSLRSLSGQIRDMARVIRQGDTSYIEEALLGQAMMLHMLAMKAVEWAFSGLSREHIEARLPFALQAQNNSRKTFETLANIRNGGRPFVVQQQNIASVQQVNNCLPANNAVTKNPANELLEVAINESLDTRTQSPSGSTHSAVATLGPGKRRQDGRGQSHQSDERPEARGKIRDRTGNRKSDRGTRQDDA